MQQSRHLKTLFCVCVGTLLLWMSFGATSRGLGWIFTPWSEAGLIGRNDSEFVPIPEGWKVQVEGDGSESPFYSVYDAVASEYIWMFVRHDGTYRQHVKFRRLRHGSNAWIMQAGDQNSGYKYRLLNIANDRWDMKEFDCSAIRDEPVGAEIGAAKAFLPPPKETKSVWGCEVGSLTQLSQAFALLDDGVSNGQLRRSSYKQLRYGQTSERLVIARYPRAFGASPQPAPAKDVDPICTGGSLGSQSADLQARSLFCNR